MIRRFVFLLLIALSAAQCVAAGTAHRRLNDATDVVVSPRSQRRELGIVSFWYTILNTIRPCHEEDKDKKDWMHAHCHKHKGGGSHKKSGGGGGGGDDHHEEEAVEEEKEVEEAEEVEWEGDDHEEHDDTWEGDDYEEHDDAWEGDDHVEYDDAWAGDDYSSSSSYAYNSASSGYHSADDGSKTVRNWMIAGLVVGIVGLALFLIARVSIF